MKKSLRITITALSGIALVISSCSKKTQPTACFDISTTAAVPNNVIAFSASCSQNASSYAWDFGDGGQATGVNPTHVYTKTGTYAVKLTASGNGQTNMIVKPITIGQPLWTLQSISQVGNIFSVFFTSADTGYLAGVTGMLLKTTNQGKTWTTLPTGTTTDLHSVCFTSPNVGYLGGVSDSILETTDGGATWTAKYIPGCVYFIYFTDANNGYAFGGNGLNACVFKTTDAGVTWTQESCHSSQRLSSACFVSVNKGYAAGSSDTIMETTNAGLTGTGIKVGNGWGISSVYFPSVDTGYAVGGDGTVFKTINAGTSWVQQSSGTYSYMNAVWFINDSTGYVAADDGLYQTTNGGNTWTHGIYTSANSMNCIYFYKNLIGFTAYSNNFYTIMYYK